MSTFDPLASQRGGDDPEFDVFLHGTVFLDIIFTGLPQMPEDGTEVWADGMGSCPGGIANLAVAAARLGLRTSLGAAFGDDDYGQFCWQSLQDEGVELAHSKRYADWHSPVTVSLASDHDRRMVTHGHQPHEDATTMIGTAPRARALLLDLSPDEPLGKGDPGRAWADGAREAGAKVFADVGWDQSGQWNPAVLDDLAHCYAFTPNAAEAMAYTRTTTPQEALYAIADRVPLAVVTNGAEGVLAIDSESDEEVSIPALRVPATDPTGAGDVFGAALLTGTLAGWPLSHRLQFAGLCSALSVQQFGGSLAAPGWGDIADWWHHTRELTDTSSHARSVRRRYAFLDDLIPPAPVHATRRAAATIARLSDA
ncbi:carbohydrate kinase family protein [Demetria terragena]|uniref:carbohydrate kinase family protein n=1 Tax=Demetria terragena TaxID=63959 RepID=UPI000375DBCC|nr:PfkB family carbohydrate kinase [Demetria terragena]